MSKNTIFCLLVLALLIITLSGCVTTARLDQAFDGWVGQHVDELVTYWGPPTSTHEMRDGRKALAYSANEFRHLQGPGIPVPFTVNLWCEVTYVSDAEGLIVSWNKKGRRKGCDILLRRKGLPPKK